VLPCLNQITLGRTPPPSLAHVARDLAAIRDGGWTAIELWLRHWEPLVEAEGIAAARRALRDSGLTVAGGCAQPGLFFSEGEALQHARDELRRRLDLCQAFGAPHLVVTPRPAGSSPPPTAADLDRAAANLRIAADLAAPYGVRLGIEFLKGVPLVNNLPTALQLAALVDRPDVGVVMDTFHLYGGLSKLEDLALLQAQPDRLFFVHVNDVPAGPRELWTDAHRVLPGVGALPLRAIFDALARCHYAGCVSLELFNDAFAARWSADPPGVSREAMASVTPLLSQAVHP
jgi:sugar phosphate isomerase/epimerase